MKHNKPLHILVYALIIRIPTSSTLIIPISTKLNFAFKQAGGEQ